MTIELSKARKGDRFEARDGEVWTYERAGAVEEGLVHLLSCEQPRFYFQRNGKFGTRRAPDSNDLIRALDTPAPEAGADAELVRRCDLDLIDDLRNPMWVHCSVGEPELDKETVVPNMELAATRIEALTRALEEARRRFQQATRFHIADRLYVEKRDTDLWAVCNGTAVMATDGLFESEPMPSNRDDEFLARTRFTLDEAMSRARDWLNRNGGGDA